MKRKILYALLSAVIAVGLWVYVVTVVSPESTETYRNITVSIDGENLLRDRGLMIVTEKIPSVTLKLSGNRSDLRKLNSSNITVTVDVSRITAAGTKELQYSISYPGDVPSGSIQVMSQSPERISLTVAKTDKKTIPVKVLYENLPEDRFEELTKEVLSLDTVTIEGPEETVAKVQKAVAMVDVGTKTQISDNYALVLCDADGNAVDSKWITASATELKVQTPIHMTQSLEVKINWIPGGGVSVENLTQDYKNNIFIKAAGSVEKLLTRTELVIDVELATLEDQANLVFDLQEELEKLGLALWDGERETLEVNVALSGLVTREQKVTVFVPINSAEGKNVTVSTKEITVILRGTAAKLAQVNEHNIIAYVDVEGKTGSSKIRPTFGFADDVADKNIGVSYDGSVSVNIS